MQYRCEYFHYEELVDPTTAAKRGEKSWQLLDDRLLMSLDWLRNRYGACTVNNYRSGGDRKWSGLRTQNSPWYSPYSQHSFGRAADCIFKHVTAEEVRSDILREEFDVDFQYITSFEEDTSWLHIDVRNVDRILTFPVPIAK
jgi:hypothetical protein